MSVHHPITTKRATRHDGRKGQEPTRALQQKPHHSMTWSAIASSVGGTLAERLRGPEIDLGGGLERGRLGA
jgi:hypothetical protein